MSRLAYLLACGAAALGLGAPAVWRPAPRLIWNASASVPIGLYAIHPAAPLRLGELVVAKAPPTLADLFARRRYLPRNVPLLKHIAALPGQILCRRGVAITVDGVTLGRALEHDHLGRPLPAWRGCFVIPPGQVFLMNRRPPDSLDGRYFGALSATAIVGRADPLWIPATHK